MPISKLVEKLVEKDEKWSNLDAMSIFFFNFLFVLGFKKKNCENSAENLEFLSAGKS